MINWLNIFVCGLAMIGGLWIAVKIGTIHIWLPEYLNERAEIKRLEMKK